MDWTKEMQWKFICLGFLKLWTASTCFFNLPIMIRKPMASLYCIGCRNQGQGRWEFERLNNPTPTRRWRGRLCPPPCFRSSYGAVIKFKDYTNWLGKGFHAVVVFGTFMYQEHRILVKSYKCLKCDFSFLKKEELSKNFQCMKWRNPTNVWNVTIVFSKRRVEHTYHFSA